MFSVLLTCESEDESIWTTRTRAEHSSLINSASALLTSLNPAKTVKPKSSSFLHKYQARGASHPVTKIAFPWADTYKNHKRKFVN